jgi:uncharacterized protein YdeI (YjbR/CyaY-like superfamily)
MNQMVFKNRTEFRAWLMENALSDQGIWIVFSKRKSPDTIKASEALEEALCFGWIDGQIRSVDENTYIKYFKQRSKSSDWSEKNKRLVEVLEQKSLMTDFGRVKVEYAKQNGHWEQSGNKSLTDEQRQQFENMLKPFERAYANFIKMSQSVRKTYMASYFFGAKTEEGKQKRFNNIIERLNLNLNPMESMKNKLKE